MQSAIEKAEQTFSEEAHPIAEFEISEKDVRRSRIMLQVYVGLFVVVASFAYGLVNGLNKKPPLAHAAFGFGEGEKISSEMQRALPRGVQAVSAGREMTINGKNAELASFFSNRSIKHLVSETTARWKSSGMKVLEMATGQRGVAVAIDETTGKRYSFTAWEIPKAMKPFVEANATVQGTLSMQHGDTIGSFAIPPVEGEVPGVPVMDGGSGGAVVSSIDAGGRSFSSVYTNPGSIGSNISYYRDKLTRNGWKESSSDMMQNTIKGYGHLHLKKKSEEIMLVFSPAKSRGLGDGQRTVVLVTRGGNILE